MKKSSRSVPKLPGNSIAASLKALISENPRQLLPCDSSAEQGTGVEHTSASRPENVHFVCPGKASAN
jgi:hypothetical protein